LTASKIIALDCDGVLLDYNAAYPRAWERAFGELPQLRNPHGYSPFVRWGIPRLDGIELDRLRACFDEEFWSTIPAIPSALEACRVLVNQGYQLVCVTALSDRFAEARTQNLRSHGFPIKRVITTKGDAVSGSPKATALNALKPDAFVDDYLPYMVGVDPRIHRALVMRDPDGSPNVGEYMVLVDSQHSNLLSFAEQWQSQQR
jgi:phosphoglycolate phosphatase-like HAD superfamily hydrolase